jgi:hypothetical protein
LYLNNFEILKTIDRKTYAYDTYVIVAKAIHNYLIANRYFFKVNIANFHSNYITLRKLFSSKFARYKLLKLNIMKIIIGMVAFVVCKYPSPEKKYKVRSKLSLQ